MADKITIEQVELTQQLAKERDRLLQIENDRLEVARQQARLDGETLSRTSETVTQSAARQNVAEQMLVLLQQEQEAIENKIKALEAAKKAAADLGQEEVDKLTAQQDKLGEILKLKRDPAALKQVVDDLERSKAKEASLQKRATAAAGLGAAFGAAVGVTNNWENGLVGTTLQLLKAEDGVERITEGLMGTFNMQNIGVSILEKVTEATLLLLIRQDAAIASFKQATAAGNSYNDVIVDSYLELRTFGVSQEVAGKATEELFKQMSQFTEMTRAAQQELVETTAILNRFGVAGTDTASSFELLIQGLGMTATEAAQTQRELFALGQALGIAPDIVFSEFGPATRLLAAHGDDMINVFEGIAAASKATGVEMNRLIGLAEQFDTFENAASSVGKLNAILGGPYFNAIEMLNATEEERIRLLIQGIEATGKSFDSLGKFEQKAIASAAGITDMAEANKLFNTSLSAFDAAQAKAAAASISQKEFEEASRNALSVQEKFVTIMENFAVSLSPVLDLLGGIADLLLELQKMMGDTGNIILALGGSVLFLVGTFKGLSLAASVAGGAMSASAPGLVAFGNAAGAAGTAAMKGSLGLLAIGAAAVGIGFGIYLAAQGIAAMIPELSKLIELMANTPGEKLAQIGLAITSLALLGYVGGLGLVALGLGFLGLSTGIAALMAVVDLEKLKELASLAEAVTEMVTPAAATPGAGAGAAESPKSPFTQLVEAVNELDETKLNHARELATVAVDFNSTVQAAAQPAGAGGASAATNLPPIYLEMDGQIFGRLVADKIAKQKGLKVTPRG